MAHVGKRSRVGQYTMTPLDGGPAVVRDLMCCVHCGYVWIAQSGSGKRRGFCTECMGFTCGHAACEKQGCLPLEQWIENCEAGQPETHRRIIVAGGC